MADNINALLDRIAGKLTESQKNKAKECGSVKELMAFLNTEGIELSDGDLESVAGGIYTDTKTPPPWLKLQ